MEQQTREEVNQEATKDKKLTTDKSIRANFENLTKKWMARSIDIISIERLYDAYLPIVPDLEEEIREAHAQGLVFMEKELKEVIDGYVEEKDLNSKMDELDTLIKEAKSKPRVEKRLVPTPEQVLRGVLCKAKEKETEVLLKELDNIKNENKLLMEKLSLLRNDLTSKRADITRDLEKFKAATTIACTIPVEKLIETMNELDLTK